VLQARVAELERRLGKDSSNSSKPPSSDGLRKPARAARRADQQTVRRRAGKQPGGPRAHLAQVADPTRSSGTCPSGAAGAARTLPARRWSGCGRQVFDLPALRLGVAEHRAQRRRCGCGKTRSIAYHSGT
jgi:transposase